MNGLDDFLTGIAPLLEGAPPDEDDKVDRDLVTKVACAYNTTRAMDRVPVT